VRSLVTISSLHNERVKLVHALQIQGKVRRKERRCALEGVRLIEDALSVGARPDFVFFTSDAESGDQPGARLIAMLRDQDVECLEVTPEVMAHLSDTQSPQGITAVVPLPELSAPAHVNLALILDGVADPGNMGTILRSAAGAGADVVVLAPHCVDPFNPKVLRSAMGAHFRIPVVRRSWAEIAQDFAELPLYLADANGVMPYYRVAWTEPAALIVGGEARGANSEAERLAEAMISIPMANEVESLNAAVAAGIILFEIRRQRSV
jgi:RNA methyltransferase, TrmH family